MREIRIHGAAASAGVTAAIALREIIREVAKGDKDTVARLELALTREMKLPRTGMDSEARVMADDMLTIMFLGLS